MILYWIIVLFKVHLIVKLVPSMKSYAISIIGGYLKDEDVTDLNKSLTYIPRLPSTKCGHFERSNKDEWYVYSLSFDLIANWIDICLQIHFIHSPRYNWYGLYYYIIYFDIQRCWIAPSVQLVDRGLLYVFDKLEALGWSQTTQFSQSQGANQDNSNTWVFRNANATKVYKEEPQEEKK